MELSVKPSSELDWGKWILDVKLDQHLCFKLYVASRLIVQNFAEVMASLSLTYPKYLVLTALGESDGLTVSELGVRLFLDSGTLSPLLKALEVAKYVKRQRSAKDDRIVVNFLTKKGRVVRDEAMTQAAAIFCRTNMTPNEFQALHRDLDLFIQRCQFLLDGRDSSSVNVQENLLRTSLSRAGATASADI